MTLHPHSIGPVLEETARIAHAASPKGNPCLHMRGLLGTLYDDQLFAALFPPQGQPALARLSPGLDHHHAICAISLSDRQAAEAVRIRIDWKYALNLELSHPGFDFSVLCEFRARLLVGHAEQLADAGYADADILVTAATAHHVEVIGPVRADARLAGEAGTGICCGVLFNCLGSKVCHLSEEQAERLLKGACGSSGP